MRNSGTFLIAYTQTYSEAGRAQSKLWPKGTLCVSIAANIAESAILSFDSCFPDSVLGFAPHENVADVLFVKYSLDQFRQVIERESQGFAQENLSLERLEAIPLPRPPYSEQRRIATILGTWDKAIATLGALIAAKQRRKQGLMQELLSGKRRFPGFKEKWKEVRLGDVFDFRNGYNTSKEQYGSGVPFVNVLDVITHPALTPSTIKGKVNLPDEALELNSVRFGDVLFNRTSETTDEVGLASVYMGDQVVTFGGFVIRARPKVDLFDPGYLVQALRHPMLRKQITALGNGAIRSNVGQGDLQGVLMRCPPIEEQKRIAAVLSLHSQEIALLTDQLTHLTTQKRGLMQQLLTGAVRVRSV